jgi:hypothetical protein
LCRPSGWGYRDNELRTFLRLINVCSRWRAVAVDTPELWGLVPCSKPERTAKLLELSKNAALTVSHAKRSNLSWSHHGELSEVLNLLQTMDRVGAVDIDFDHALSQSETDSLRVALLKAAPVLRSLDLASSSGLLQVQLPDDLFNKHAPRLRRLALQHCRISASSITFPGLQILDLKGAGVQLYALMEALSATPQLEELRLVESVSGLNSALEAELPSLELACLRTLVVDERFSVLSSLLKRVSAYRLWKLQLRSVNSGPITAGDILATDLVSSFIARTGNRISSMLLDQNSYTRRWTLLASSSPDMKYCPVDSPSVPFSMSAEDADPLLPGQKDSLARILGLMGSLRLQTMKLTIMDCTEYTAFNTDKALWLQAFPFPYGALRQLTISGSVAAGLVEALGHSEGGPAKKRRTSKSAKKPARTPVFFLGGLRILEVVGDVDFRRTVASGSNLRDLLMQHLKLRSAAGISLDTLSVEACKGFSGKDEIAVVKGGWAKEVLWDGICTTEDEESESDSQEYDEDEDMNDSYDERSITSGDLFVD